MALMRRRRLLVLPLAAACGRGGKPPKGWKELSFLPRRGDACEIGKAAIRCDRMALRALVSIAYEVPQSRIYGSPEFDGVWLKATAVAERDSEAEFRALLKSALEDEFGLKTRLESRKIPVKLLRVAEAGKLKAAGEGSDSMRGTRNSLSGAGPVAVLLPQLDAWLGEPVVDDTGLGGRYEFAVSWNQETTLGIIPALREQLGLELVRGTRELGVLIVERFELPRALR